MDQFAELFRYHDQAAAFAHDHLLAFDKVGDQRILSEVWLPDHEGALVHATPGEHTHEIIRLSAKGGGTR